MFASGFSWFRLIPAIDRDTVLEQLGLMTHWMEGHEVAHSYVHVHAWLACFLVLGFAVLGRISLGKAIGRQGLEKYFASESLDARTAAEVFAGGIRGMVSDLLDRKDTRAFFPYIASLFLYIFLCNIQGIFPGFLPPTDNVNTNVGMAIGSFLIFNYIGLSRDPVGYIKHLMGPALFIAPLLFPIEVLSLIIRPISLTVRLTANLYGDHQVFTLLSDQIPVVVPVGLLALAMMVSVIQAFVFSLLTVVYISLSLPHDDHDHDHGGEAPAH
jgi:F-type H+-transporting ATPase subunit a